MRLRLLAAAALFACAGCVNPWGTQDAMQPGEALGTFSASATQTSTSCGTGALGAPPSYAFQVTLSRDPTAGVVYWNTGQGPIQGQLAPDGVSFSLTSSSVVDMRAAPSGDPETTSQGGGMAMPSLPPCSIERDDAVTGTLAPDATSFSGTMSYTFSPTSGSSCEDLVVSATPTFAALPCEMLYGMSGARAE